jgi:hypothetical protein
MMFLWACAGVPLGAYNIVSNFNIALQVQPQILTVLSLITWGQCFHYDDVSHQKRRMFFEMAADEDQKWGTLKCTLFVVGIAACFGAVETGLTFGLKVCIHSTTFFVIGIADGSSGSCQAR